MDPTPKRAWYLNLDAEEELRARGAVNPSRDLTDRCARLGSRLTGLVPDGDVAWTSGGVTPRVDGARAMAWCPTPHALRVLRAAGAITGEAPSWEVLREANHRSFSAGIAQPLPGAAYALDEATLDAVLSERSVTGVWMLKRPLGYRGGGRLRVRGDALDEAGRRWVRASLSRDGGVQVEPEVERLEDHGQHGFLSRDGRVTWGVLTRQRVDAYGAWEASERADDALTAEELVALWDVRERVADGLRELGFYGPFGVDAFRWRDPSGRARYCPLCEVNARYSMGWAVGMAGARVDLDDP